MKELSDWHLIRLIMNRLWRIYDAGGVSLGRSLRCSLLEAITDTYPLERFENDLYLEDLRQLAYQREYVSYVQLTLDLGVNGLTPEHFVCFVIRKIRQWYEYDGLMDSLGSSYEYEIVQCLCYITRCEDNLQHFDRLGVSYTARELILEAKDRQFTANMYNSSPV